MHCKYFAQFFKHEGIECFVIASVCCANRGIRHERTTAEAPSNLLPSSPCGHKENKRRAISKCRIRKNALR